MNLAVFIKLYPTLEALSRSLLQSSKYFTLSFFHKGEHLHTLLLSLLYSNSTHFIIVLNYSIWITHKCPGSQMSPFPFSLSKLSHLTFIGLLFLTSVTISDLELEGCIFKLRIRLKCDATEIHTKTLKKWVSGLAQAVSKSFFCNFFHFFFHFDCDELSDQGYTSLPKPDESESGKMALN